MDFHNSWLDLFQSFERHKLNSKHAKVSVVLNRDIQLNGRSAFLDGDLQWADLPMTNRLQDADDANAGFTFVVLEVDSGNS